MFLSPAFQLPWLNLEPVLNLVNMQTSTIVEKAVSTVKVAGMVVIGPRTSRILSIIGDLSPPHLRKRAAISG